MAKRVKTVDCENVFEKVKQDDSYRRQAEAELQKKLDEVSQGGNYCSVDAELCNGLCRKTNSNETGHCSCPFRCSKQQLIQP